MGAAVKGRSEAEPEGADEHGRSFGFSRRADLHKRP
jgi:hypothetical protein